LLGTTQSQEFKAASTTANFSSRASLRLPGPDKGVDDLRLLAVMNTVVAAAEALMRFRKNL